jgi:hypothetical protein
VLLALCGCECMNNTERGATAGGVLGSGVGLVAGGLMGRPLAGAAIGAGTGVLAGAAVGSGVDRREERAEARAVAQANAINAQNPPLSLQDVAFMAQKHHSDALIIQQIRTTNSVFALSPAQIDWLKSQGVSDAVILEMQSRRPTAVVPVRGRVVPATATSVYVVEPPPPPVAVGVGFGYGGGCRRCGW